MSYESPSTTPWTYASYGKDITMTASGDGVTGDGIYQNGLSIASGRIYFLQYDYRVRNTKCVVSSPMYVGQIPAGTYVNTMTELNVKFANPTADFMPPDGQPNLSTIPTGVPSQLIQQLTNVVENSSYQTATSCIVADANYDAIWFYPRLVNAGKKSRIQIKNIKLWEVSAGADASVGCTGTFTLGQGCATIPGATYSWSPSTGLNSTSVLNPTVNLSSLSGTTTYTLTVSVNGCSQSDQIVLTQNKPIVNLGSDGYYCPIVILNAGNAGCTYLWSSGQTTQSIMTSNVGTVCVTVTNPSNGCQGTDCIQMYADRSPCATFTYTTGCSNCRTQIGVQASCSLNGTHTWQMYASDASGTQGSLIATGSGTSCTLTSTSGSFIEYYLVRHWVENRNCSITHIDQLVHVTPESIDPVFTLSLVDGENTSHYHVQATAHDIPDCAGYWWGIYDITNGTPVNVMENPSNWWAASQVPSTWFPGYCCDTSQTTGYGTFLYGKTYRIIRGVWSGCSPWTQHYIDFYRAPLKAGQSGEGSLVILREGTVVGREMPSISAADLLMITPNPSSGRFSIQYKGDPDEVLKVQIISELGNVIYEESNIKLTEVDLSSQARGIYFVKITTSQSFTTKKIIIQ
jgi:hypothetical protein